jgi:hypothetical protein
MNTDTENSTTSASDAFGTKGTKMNSISFSHPYAEDIIDRAKELMNESETGRALIHAQEIKKSPVHVLKGDGDSGYNPQSNVIYVPISGKKDRLDAKTFILFVKAYRTMEQEFVGLETPTPTMEVTKYAGRLHAKNVDSILYACKVVSEMSSSKVFPNLLDAIEAFGYSDLYKGYENKATLEELYKIYSEG